MSRTFLDLAIAYENEAAALTAAKPDDKHEEKDSPSPMGMGSLSSASDNDSPAWKRTLEFYDELESEVSDPDDKMEPPVKKAKVETPEHPKSPSTPLSFTPSSRPTDEINFFGRRTLRIMAGQDPKKHPELFTPQVDPMKFDWPVWPSFSNKCTCYKCK